MRRHRPPAGAAWCLLAAWLAGPAWACDVPVHRWATERWAPDPYPVWVFAQEPLTPGAQSALDRLEAGAAEANLELRVVDPATATDARDRALWQAQAGATLPWLVARYPRPAAVSAHVWAGPLSEEAVEALLDSPMRREAARHLAQGDAVVWVLLDGDDALAETLERTLEDVVRRPPEPTASPNPANPPRTFPLPRFPTIRVSRTDPAEQAFAAMLLGVEPDLEAYDEPMAFPLFGRGRALYALVGPGIGAENVRRACAFLLGACSCQVKDENPGMDLLMAVDWNAHIGDVEAAEDPPPPLPGVIGEGAVAAVEAEASPTPAAPSRALTRNLLAVVGAGVLAVAGASLAIRRGRGSRWNG